MALWLVDSNVLLRAMHHASAEHLVAQNALDELQLRGDTLCFTLQVMAEFWAVATRPPAVRGGLGLSSIETYQRFAKLEPYLTFLEDTESVRSHWRTLVMTHRVQGVQVHDARLAAAMLAHQVPHLLTFNDTDFRRYEPLIAVYHPNVLSTAP